MVSCKEYEKILCILEPAYEIPPKIRNRSPLDELVLVILSQNTSDNNSFLAFGDLFEKFANYKKIANSSEKKIADAIRRGGLANQKARWIKNTVEKAHERSGEYNLDFLSEMKDHEALEYLTSLDGVGPKSARCVLLFSLGRDFFPVDTHVFRVSKRLGFIPGKMKSREKACHYIESVVEPEHRYKLHMTLILHGRSVCKARNPVCKRCPVSHLCNYYLEMIPGNGTEE